MIRQELLEAEKQRQEQEAADLAQRTRKAGARTDDSIDDDPAGIARRKLAESSRERRGEEAQAAARRNAEEGRRLHNTAARTDDDINDEAAGRARKSLAKASQKRREEEAAQLARANAKVAQRRNNTNARTDDNIDDEEAGRARKALAEASKLRREAEAKELARQNSNFLQMIRHQSGTRTDSNIIDEPAGRARKQLAESSRRRREEETERIARANEQLKLRLDAIKSKTDDGDGGGEFESTALTLLERDTDVWRASFLRFEVEQQNKSIASHLREEQVLLRQQKADQERLWLAEGQALSRERRQRQKRLRKIQNEVRKHNRASVRSVRNAEAKGLEAAEARDREYREVARMRVLEANELDSRLDAAEEAQDAREREEGTRLRLSLAAALTRTRSEILAEKREVVNETQAARTGPASARAACFSPRRGQEKRDESKQWAQQRAENEDEYLHQATANRLKAERQRALTRKSMMQLMKFRKKEAVKERANDYLVKDEKARILTSNRKEVAAVYARRFASKDQVSRMWSSVGGGLIAPLSPGTPRSPGSRSVTSI